MSEQWYSASESDSDQEERRDWVQERARSDQVTALPRWEDISYGNPGMRSCMWENPLQMSGIGRGLSSAEVVRQATSSYSRLVREVAARESPVTESKVSAMTPVQYDKRQWSLRTMTPRFLWVLSRSRWCSGGGHKAGRHSMWPPLEWPTCPNLVEMWSSYRVGGITRTVCARCLAVACGPGN